MHSQHCGYWCPGAKAPGHQYPQYWLNLQFIGPVSYESIRLLLDNIRKWNCILKKMTQSFKGKSIKNPYPQSSASLSHTISESVLQIQMLNWVRHWTLYECVTFYINPTFAIIMKSFWSPLSHLIVCTLAAWHFYSRFAVIPYSKVTDVCRLPFAVPYADLVLVV